MAKPRIFISSTYYDLKHIRSSLDAFVESMGFEPILSEKGDIAYSPEAPLDESCYKEVLNADILVLIIGGRYGSKASDQGRLPKDFYKRYESITKKEVEAALNNEIPVYILVEQAVFNEYETYKHNKDNSKVKYAHVDSVNIFHLIEMLISLPKNNPIKSFEKFTEIEEWLRDQWSGLFRDLLKKSARLKGISELSEQVSTLKETNSTLKTYLESIIRKIEPDSFENIIKTEDDRLKRHLELKATEQNDLASYIMSNYELHSEELLKIFKRSDDIAGLVSIIRKRDGFDGSFMDDIVDENFAKQDFEELKSAIKSINKIELDDKGEENKP